MPQLDKVTFLSQFLWLCLFFLGFYIVAIKFFLPKMSRILCYRKKRLNQSNQGVTDLQEENDKVRLSAEKLLESGLKNSKDAFKLSLHRTNNWLSEYRISTNQTNLKKTNRYYLRSLGERSVLHNLLVESGFRDFSNMVFMSALTRKLKSVPTQDKSVPTQKLKSVPTRRLKSVSTQDKSVFTQDKSVPTQDKPTQKLKKVSKKKV